MSYEFPTDIRSRLEARLQQGEYQNEDDVIRDAMDALDQLELEKLARWNDRNRAALEESRQGLSRPLDESSLLDRVRQRLAQEGIVE